VDEIVDVGRPADGALLQEAAQQRGAGPGFLGAGLQQVEELILFAQKFFEREHGCRFG